MPHAHHTAFVFLRPVTNQPSCTTKLKNNSAQNRRAIRVTVGLAPAGLETVRVVDIKKPPAFLLKDSAGGWANMTTVTSPSL